MVIGNTIILSAGESNFFIAGVSVDQLSGNNENYNDENLSMVNIFPNPASTFVSFNISPESSQLEVAIYTITGATVAEHSLKNVFNSKVTLDISTLHSEIYVLVIKDSYEIYRGKFIVE